MTAIAHRFPYSLLNSDNTAVSQDGVYIEGKLKGLKKHKSQSISFGIVPDLKSEIVDLQRECSTEGWDGRSAKLISNSALLAIIQLAELLPDGIQAPEPVAEPSGIMGIEWISDNGNRLLLTPKSNSLIFAGLLGQKTIHGTTNLSKELPDEITKYLFEFFSK